MGALNAVFELLVQNRRDAIHVLPSLPRRWRALSFDGIRCEGAFLVGATVAGGRVVEVRVRSLRGGCGWRTAWARRSPSTARRSMARSSSGPASSIRRWWFVGADGGFDTEPGGRLRKLTATTPRRHGRHRGVSNHAAFLLEPWRRGGSLRRSFRRFPGARKSKIENRSPTRRLRSVLLEQQRLRRRTRTSAVQASPMIAGRRFERTAARRSVVAARLTRMDRGRPRPPTETNFILQKGTESTRWFRDSMLRARSPKGTSEN